MKFRSLLNKARYTSYAARLGKLNSARALSLGFLGRQEVAVVHAAVCVDQLDPRSLPD